MTGLERRSSGLLLHPTSLPNDFPIGDVGPAAFDFVDYLATAGQRWWQMLPLSPIGPGNSPYQSSSSFAANTLLISPERLAEDGLLERSQLNSMRGAERDRVLYAEAQTSKTRALRLAFNQFQSSATPAQRRALAQFVRAERVWLPDFALFTALQSRYGDKPWWEWDPDVRRRRPAAVEAARRDLAYAIGFQEFAQWQFARQWIDLRRHAAKRGVGMIGDLPIFVSANSADVWANPDLFTLKPNGRAAVVAGVPPDYFSETGQLWGNPHYRWDVMRKDGYAWWTERLRKVLRYFDAVRIDHFIGFVRYYEIPAGATTAVHGKYKAGPGADFFRRVLKKLGKRGQGSLIAEDLGIVTPQVKALRDQFGFPGMKVLQFAFGDDPEARSYQPHNLPRNAVVYTGTHDNNTTVGWFRQEACAHPKEKEFTLRYLSSDGRQIHWDMIRAAMASAANTAIIPVQDILGLGPENRMNRPGTPAGNWEWRLAPGALTPSLAKRLRVLSETYRRK